MANPAMVQMASWPSSSFGIVGEPGNSYKMPFANRVGAGNCLLVAFTWDNTRKVAAVYSQVIDPSGNFSIVPWRPDPAAYAHSTNGVDSAIYVLPNAPVGYHSVVVVLTGLTSTGWTFQPTIIEFFNLDPVNPVNGASYAVDQTNAGSGVAAGSLTPGTNDANGGNLIFAYAGLAAATGNGNPSSFVPGGSFTLLDGDILWVTGQGWPHASMYFVQTSAAAITPTITPTGDTTNAYNVLAVALRAANAGTPRPSGMYINKMLHFSVVGTATTAQPFCIPSEGNLGILSTPADTSQPVTSAIDNDGSPHTWTDITPGAGVPMMWYGKNLPPNTSRILTLTCPSGILNNYSFRFLDVQGADPNPLDQVVKSDPVDVSNITSISNFPDLTPVCPPCGGLSVATGGLGQGPGYTVTSPAGAIFDLINYTAQTDGSAFDNSDLHGHLFFTNNLIQHWNWTFSPQASNTAFATGASFKAAFGAGITKKCLTNNGSRTGSRQARMH